MIRMYVMERLKIEAPELQISFEDLGGQPEEQDNQDVRQMVEQLLNLPNDIDQNVELQRLVNQVGGNCAKDVFMTVANSACSDGLNWGRMVVVLQLAYIFIHRAIITNQRENIEGLIRGAALVLNERTFWWLILQTGWEICRFPRWRTVATVASIVVVASLVYCRTSR